MASTVAGIEVIYRPANRDFSKRWLDFGPSTKILPKGWSKEPGRRVLSQDLIFDRDVAITLRDGVTVYADVFRPPSSKDEPVPAVMGWSPYGKQGNGFQSLDKVPFRAGVPRDQTSDLEKFEALDPAEWCPRGYAIVNIDPRGTFDSEGNIVMLGTQEGRDGYDVVEFLAAQSWCNGSVGLAGNSWLGASQWLIAAEKPPHLKAIAPWEGFSDLYREIFGRGGIPNPAFSDYRSSGYCGKNGLENAGDMVRKYPLINAYWDDKRAKLGQIDIPIYCLASFSSGLHTEGSLRGFLFSSSSEKWLRIHHTQEWYDLYQQENIDDLQRFFDKYLRGQDNGWEATPRVRHSLLGFNVPCVINREETTYPPPYVKHTTFFLDCANSTLTPDAAPKSASSCSYTSNSWDDDGVHFTYVFTTYTELIGYSKVTLYMACPDTDEMDVYVILRKLDKDGKPLLHINIPLSALPSGTTASDVPDLNIFKYVGPNGRLRASHRRIEPDPWLTPDQEALLSPANIFHPHTEPEEKIPRGEVVRLNIPLWAGGMVFHAGEAMRLEVKGHEVTLPEFPALDRVPTNLNQGKHFVHSGHGCESLLVVPLSVGE